MLRLSNIVSQSFVYTLVQLQYLTLVRSFVRKSPEQIYLRKEVVELLLELLDLLMCRLLLSLLTSL